MLLMKFQPKLARAWKIAQWIDGATVAADLEVQDMCPVGCLPNLGEILPTLDPVALSDQETPIETICAEIVFIMLDNNKVTVALESTSTVNNRPSSCGLDHLAGQAADPDTLPRPVTLAESLGQLA